MTYFTGLRMSIGNRYVTRAVIVLALQSVAMYTEGQSAAPSGGGANATPVVAEGVVPDEGTRQAILTRLRQIYGNDRVVDQLGVANVQAPPEWKNYVQKILSLDLKQVGNGRLSISGNVVNISGEVANESLQQQWPNALSNVLNPTYTVRSDLRVGNNTSNELNAAVANRTIEFQSGTAMLTANGQQVLDQLLPIIQKLQGRRFEIVGHTDSVGDRGQNMNLSMARAAAVKSYLISKGVNSDAMTSTGVGPDGPIASNATEAGRARNRRIEFRMLP